MRAAPQSRSAAVICCAERFATGRASPAKVPQGPWRQHPPKLISPCVGDVAKLVWWCRYIDGMHFGISPHWGLNPGPSVYKTDALPLSCRGNNILIHSIEQIFWRGPSWRGLGKRHEWDTCKAYKGSAELVWRLCAWEVPLAHRSASIRCTRASDS